MQPVLFTIGSIPISSFGLFLALALLLAIFVTWRIARIYDIDEEKIIDLSLLSFFGGLISARAFYVALHWPLLGDFTKAVLINRYPGLYFWGGLLGGILAFSFFVRRSKWGFWQIADFGAVGLSLGLAIGDLGCFLGGCSYGTVSSSVFALPVVGLVGKRFPIPGVEALLFLIVFFYLWEQVVKFHFSGKIAGLFFIFLGIVKFVTEFYRADVTNIPELRLTVGQLWAVVTLLFGVIVFYSRSKRNLIRDLKYLAFLCYSAKKRKALLLQMRKNWYNLLVSFKLGSRQMLADLRSMPRNLRRKLNVKPTPKNLR